MYSQIFKIIFLTYLLKLGESNLTELSEPIKEDILKIYNNSMVDIPLLNVPVNPDDIKYYLFTSTNSENYQEINRSDPSQLSNVQNPVVFLVHGWRSDRTTEWYELVKDAFFIRDPAYYIVQIDWSEYSFRDYVSAAHSVKGVGEEIGKFIKHLVESYNVPINNILIVGHSLGGQVSSFVGKEIKESGKILPRIIPLDPAGPLFHGKPESERLNPNDARVVSVIHSNGGVFGYLASCGTIDFFPNGGTHQPGCLDSITEIACSHLRCWMYYEEAIRNPDGFVSRRCETVEGSNNDTVTMGDLNTTQTGNFCLTTNAESPYSKE